MIPELPITRAVRSNSRPSLRARRSGRLCAPMPRHGGVPTDATGLRAGHLAAAHAAPRFRARYSRRCAAIRSLFAA